MLKKIEDAPDYVGAFIATGKVNKEEYEKILIPELDRLNKIHGRIHFLLVLETPVKNFSLGAWLHDAKLGLKHYTNWKRVAIVSDERSVRTFTNKFTFFLPGKTKAFKLSEVELAKKWVAEE